MELNKVIEFTAALQGGISTVFKEDSEFFMSEEDRVDYATEFMIALMVILPAIVLKNVAEGFENSNFLECNQLANTLCVQYMQAMRDEHGNPKKKEE